MNAVIITFSLCVLSLAPYAVWASRWNIPAHLSLAFAVTAYLIPGLLTDGISSFGRDTVELYTDILAVGAFTFCAGCAVGAAFRQSAGGKNHFFTARRTPGWWERDVSRRVTLMALCGIFGLVLSFAVMGVIPLFAEDPLSAKFFRGQYKEAYEKVAPLYRSSHFALSMLVPILLAFWSDTGKRKYLLLALAAVAILALSLTRTPAAAGVVIWLGIWVAKRPQYFMAYLLLLVFIYSLGGAVFMVFSEFLFGFSLDQSVWDFIAQGAPDIVDQLNFLEAFQRREEFTYGRTMVGGLVPGNYKWNPSVWALNLVTDSDDVSTIASGGLRLPAPVWGYANFGWFGVLSFSWLAGIFTARATLYLRRYIQSPSHAHSAVVVAIYTAVWLCLINFYRLSFYTVFQILIVYILAGAWGALRTKASKGSRARLFIRGEQRV